MLGLGKVQLRLMGKSLFDQKQKNWRYFGLMVALEEKIQ